MIHEKDRVRDAIDPNKTGFSSVQAILALGLLVIEKHDKAALAAQPTGQAYTANDLTAADAFTDRQIKKFDDEANQLLFSIYQPLESSRVQWWWSVWGGVVSAFCWSILLIIIGYGIIRICGVDIVSVLQAISGSSPNPNPH
jgi:hypothetical protein